MHPTVILFAATSTPGPVLGIDTSIVVAIVALIGTIFTVVYANRYTAKNAREAAIKSAEQAAKAQSVELAKMDEQRRQNLMDNMQEEITRLDKMRREDRDEYIRVRQEDRDEFNRRISEATSELMQIRLEHEQYRRERSFLQQQVDALILWSRAVVRQMRAAGIAYPPPPPGVDGTDPNGFPPVRSH
jgi:F0F1-type ATP synthase membrane subunit b/b'